MNNFNKRNFLTYLLLSTLVTSSCLATCVNFNINQNSCLVKSNVKQENDISDTFVYKLGSLTTLCKIESEWTKFLNGTISIFLPQNATGDLVVPLSINYNSNVYNVIKICTSVNTNFTTVDFSAATKLEKIVGFNDMPQLTTVKFPKNGSLFQIGNIFNNCPNVTSISSTENEIEIPNTIKSITGPIFDKSSKLKTDTSGVVYSASGEGLNIWCLGYKGTSNQPTSSYEVKFNTYGIAPEAFLNCTALSGELKIPSSVQFIGSKAFYGTNYNVDSNGFCYSQYLTSQSYKKWFIGYISNKTFRDSELKVDELTYGIADNPLCDNFSQTQIISSYDLPVSLEIISGLPGPIASKIVLPENLTYIFGELPPCYSVYVKTTKIKSIVSNMFMLNNEMKNTNFVIPDSVVRIEEYGLSTVYDTALSSIIFGNNLEYIGPSAFENIKLVKNKSIIFPASLKTLNHSFHGSDIVANSIYFKSTTPPDINEYSLPKLDRNVGKCIVPRSEDHSVLNAYIERFTNAPGDVNYTKDQIVEENPVTSTDLDISDANPFYVPTNKRKFRIIFNNDNWEGITPEFRPTLTDLQISYETNYISISPVKETTSDPVTADDFTFYINFLQPTPNLTKTKLIFTIDSPKIFDAAKEVTREFTIYKKNDIRTIRYADDAPISNIEAKINKTYIETEDLRSYILDQYDDRILPTDYSKMKFELSGTLPKGLKFDQHSGMISGTPTQSGYFNDIKIIASYTFDTTTNICTSIPFDIYVLEIKMSNFTLAMILVGVAAGLGSTIGLLIGIRYFVNKKQSAKNK